MGGGIGKVAAIAGALALAGGAAIAAETCPGNPNALGTHRTIAVDPLETPLIGTHDYRRTLPLAPGEVVLTFDDGPLSPYTTTVLRALAQHCVKAVFFLVGRMARHEPQTVRQIAAAGHTIGTHTQNHPLRSMAAAQAVREISTGIDTVKAVLQDPNALAPFFRFPGLYHPVHAEHYLRSRGLAAWSIDIDSFDWKRNTAQGVLRSVLARLEHKGRGILLFHDIQPKTALLLPELLVELKQRGYRVVHVVPSGRPSPDVVASSPVPETTGVRVPAPDAAPKPWPVAVVSRAPAVEPAPVIGTVPGAMPPSAVATTVTRESTRQLYVMPALTRTRVATAPARRSVAIETREPGYIAPSHPARRAQAVADKPARHAKPPSKIKAAVALPRTAIFRW